MVSIITFSLMHSVPGGPFDESKQPLPAAAKANILRKYGLDKPVWQQYLLYMWAVVHFDFGIPFQSPTETVTQLIARVWPPTLQLAGVVIFSSYSIGLLLGILAATYQNSWIDQAVTFLATLGFTIPNFVLGFWLIIIFSVKLHWLPYRGMGDAGPVYYAGVCLCPGAHGPGCALYPGQHAGGFAGRLRPHCTLQGSEGQYHNHPPYFKKSRSFH